MIVPPAHVGHWLTDLLIVAPVLIAVLVVVLRERLAKRRGGDAGAD